MFADWSDFFASLPGILMIVFVFGGWVIAGVVSTLARNWRKAKESEHLAVLKQSMIEKGMSVEEIERVLRAAPAPASHDESPVVELTAKLAEHDVPAKNVEEILTIFRASDPATQQTVARAVESMLDNGGDAERVSVAVRALAGVPSQESPSRDARFTDEAASFRR